MTTLITRDELKNAVDAHSLTVIDALPAAYYDQQHLPGAINLIEADVDAKAATLFPDKDAPIVTYCANAACPNSQQVATRLEHLGYTNVRTYREGIQDWVEAGLPTESTAAA